MKTNLFNARHHGRVGLGGWRCYCCEPAPKHRGSFVRLHKRFVYRILDQLEQE